MSEIKPFKIRDIEINPPLVLSPMAGVTDISFRRLLKARGGVGLSVSEFISVEGLTRNNPKSKRQMRFYENERAVRTASSQQVRKPIFRDGLDQFRHYESWLAPLKGALGSVLEAYPGVPEFT